MKLILSLASVGLICTAASGSETVTYTYDAKGRLVRVQHSGGPISGADKQYSYDKANNRSNVLVSGVGSGGGGLITDPPPDPGFPEQPVDPPPLEPFGR